MVMCLYWGGQGGIHKKRWEGISLMCINVTRSKSGKLGGEAPGRSHLIHQCTRLPWCGAQSLLVGVLKQ